MAINSQGIDNLGSTGIGAKIVNGTNDQLVQPDGRTALGIAIVDGAFAKKSPRVAASANSNVGGHVNGGAISYRA